MTLTAAASEFWPSKIPASDPASAASRGLRVQLMDRISGWVPDNELDRLLKACSATGSYTSVRTAVQSMLASGYSVNVTLERICEAVVSDKVLDNTQKAIICERLAGAEKRLIDGADDELQLLDVCLMFQRVSKGITISSDADRKKFLP